MIGVQRAVVTKMGPKMAIESLACAKIEISFTDLLMLVYILKGCTKTMNLQYLENVLISLGVIAVCSISYAACHQTNNSIALQLSYSRGHIGTLPKFVTVGPAIVMPRKRT